jgi:hypothetical protein
MLGTPTCNVTLQRPSGSILLVGTLGDAWQITGRTGFGAATLTVNQPSCNSPAAIPNVTANRPSCSSAYVGILGGRLSPASVSSAAWSPLANHTSRGPVLAPGPLSDLSPFSMTGLAWRTGPVSGSLPFTGRSAIQADVAWVGATSRAARKGQVEGILGRLAV